MLIFIDPCDDLSVPADITANGWQGPVGTGNNVFNVGAANSGASGTGRCITATTTNTGAAPPNIQAPLQVLGAKASQHKTRMSFWMKLNGSTNGGRSIAGWYEDTYVFGLYLDNSNALYLYATPDAVGAALNIPGAVSDNQWHHYEIEKVTHPTTGTVKVWKDGVLVVDFTGRTSFSTSASSASAQGLISGPRLALPTLGTLSFDDILIWNDEDNGDGFVGYMGVCYLDTLRPTAEGDTQQFTPSTGTGHFGLVNDSSSSADTTYVSATAPNQRELFQLADLSATYDTIKAVAVKTTQVSQSVGPGKVKHSIKSGGVIADGPEFDVTTLNAFTRASGFGKDPATGAAWTTAGVNALQAGLVKTN